MKMKGSTPTVFDKKLIKKNISLLLLMERIQTKLLRFEDQYSLYVYQEKFLQDKRLLTQEEDNKSLTPQVVDKTLNEVLIEDKNKSIRSKR